jgi:hypothetical protein
MHFDSVARNVEQWTKNNREALDARASRVGGDRAAMGRLRYPRGRPRLAAR